MLTIICGEDSIASRTYFITLQKEFKQKGYAVKQIQGSQIDTLREDESEQSLFMAKQLYVVENLQSALSRNKKKLEYIANLTESKTIDLIDWEKDKSAKEIKIKATTIKEFKLSQSIFQFVESCYPGNLQQFISLLNELSKTQEDGFIFSMLCRQTRLLILASYDGLDAMPSWMKQKYKTQANKWNKASLVSFYDRLAGLDISLKTSSNMYGIKKSLELLGCYFLK